MFLIVFGLYLVWLFLWIGVVIWIKVNSTFVMLRLAENGLPPPEVLLNPWPGPVAFLLKDYPILLFGYISSMLILAGHSRMREKQNRVNPSGT